MRIVDAKQMKRIEARAIERYAMPSLLLMENAAIAVTTAIEERYPEADRIFILCGRGMNGGDGLSVGRHLHNHGLFVDVLIVGPLDALRGDALTMLTAARGSGVKIEFGDSPDALERWLARASDGDLVVDALFGTGLNRAPDGVEHDAIAGVNLLRLPVISVDIPSGVDASRSSLAWSAIHADVTVTFGLPKIAHIFSPSSILCGDVVVADVSIPHAAVDEEDIRLSIMTSDEVDEIVPRRESDSHKGTHGHVAIVGGSPGRSGAAVLAARGALRGGAGLVTVVTDRDTAAIVDAHSIESMSRANTLTDVAELLRLLEPFDVVAIGPGLADNEESYSFLRQIISRMQKPLVLDAGAISAFAGQPELLSGKTPRILTPHPGEMARLLGKDTADVQGDRIAAVRECASRSGAVVVLKGHETLVADPAGNVSVNPTGNPAMAAGGMGDVLTGLIASLLSQHLDSWDAARVGAYLHGLAGDLAAAEIGDRGLLASEVADALPQASKSVRE